MAFRAQTARSQYTVSANFLATHDFLQTPKMLARRPGRGTGQRDVESQRAEEGAAGMGWGCVASSPLHG